MSKEKADDLAEVRDKMGLSKEAAEKVIKGVQNQHLIGNLQVTPRAGISAQDYSEIHREVLLRSVLPEMLSTLRPGDPGGSLSSTLTGFRRQQRPRATWIWRSCWT